MAVETAGSVQVGQRAVLFDDKPFAAAYDVHPDGRRFVMIRLASESPQVVVVLNLFEQLRAELTRGAGSP